MRRYIIGASWVVLVASCTLSAGPEPTPSAPPSASAVVGGISPRPTATSTVLINGREFRIDPSPMSTALWRDFQPISPPDGKPLIATIRVAAVDGGSFPPDITVDRLWVYGPSVWDTAPTEVRRSPDAGRSSQIEVVAREGPKWEPGTRVDVVIRLRSGSASFHLQLIGVPIERTS